MTIKDVTLEEWTKAHKAVMRADPEEFYTEQAHENGLRASNRMYSPGRQAAYLDGVNVGLEIAKNAKH